MCVRVCSSSSSMQGVGYQGCKPEKGSHDYKSDGCTKVGLLLVKRDGPQGSYY